MDKKIRVKADCNKCEYFWVSWFSDGVITSGSNMCQNPKRKNDILPYCYKYNENNNCKNFKKKKVKKFCKECKYYEFVDYSDWTRSIIFHNCLSKNKTLKKDQDCINNRNKNNDCKVYKKGDPVNTEDSEKEIKRQKWLKETKNKVDIYDKLGYMPSKNGIKRFFQKLLIKGSIAIKE